MQQKRRECKEAEKEKNCTGIGNAWVRKNYKRQKEIHEEKSKPEQIEIYARAGESCID